MLRATLLLIPLALLAAEPALNGTYEAISLDGSRVGVVHSSVRELPPGGKAVRVQVQELTLTFQRGNSSVEVRQEHGIEEDVEGRLVALYLRQFQGTKLFMEVRATVDPKSPDRLEVVRDGKPGGWMRWSEATWRPGDLDRAPGQPHWRPGDKGTVRLYDPTYNAVLTCSAVAKEKETLVIDGKRIPAVVLEIAPEPLVGANQRLEIPKTRWWLDETGRVVRRELDMPGLGMLTLTRTPGKAPVVVAPNVNVLERGLIALDRIVPRPYATSASRLRLTLTDVPEPAKALVSDEHQTVQEIKPGVLDVVVHPVGDQARSEPLPGREYLGSSHWLDTESKSFAALVARLPVAPRDPWLRAQTRAEWVRRNLKADNSVSFVPVSKIASELRGDCRQAAMLTTALCRAEGLPARTAIGVVYIERNRKPFLGFHMWTEVFVEGAWRGLDGTPGIGTVGALHLKVNDASWAGENTLVPLQPALKLVGKMNAEILESVE